MIHKAEWTDRDIEILQYIWKCIMKSKYGPKDIINILPWVISGRSITLNDLALLNAKGFINIIDTRKTNDSFDINITGDLNTCSSEVFRRAKLLHKPRKVDEAAKRWGYTYYFLESSTELNTLIDDSFTDFKLYVLDSFVKAPTMVDISIQNEIELQLPQGKISSDLAATWGCTGEGSKAFFKGEDKISESSEWLLNYGMAQSYAHLRSATLTAVNECILEVKNLEQFEQVKLSIKDKIWSGEISTNEKSRTVFLATNSMCVEGLPPTHNL